MRSQRVRLLVQIALIAVLSFVLGNVKVWEMPQGGSISLEMLPIVVFALVEGAGPAVIAGLLAGALGAVLRPEIVHWVQFLLDYPLAYGAVGLAGLFSGSWWKALQAGKWSTAIWTAILPGTFVGALARYPFHVLSGYVFFGQYAPPGQPVLVYSLIYNSFVFPAALLVFVAAAIVVPALARTPLFAHRVAGQ